MHSSPSAKRRGFTLIELLIVVAIIAVLAAIAVPNFLEAETRARIARVRADLRAMTTAIESYAVDHGVYPPQGALDKNGLIQQPECIPLPPAHKFACSGLTTPVAYLTSVPEDPFVAEDAAAPAEWRPFVRRYFYTNMVWYGEICAPSAPPVIAAKRARWGDWILAGAGPDGDRLDLAADLAYDPTNGTISDGDIIVGQRSAGR